MEKFKTLPQAKKRVDQLLKDLELRPEKKVDWFIKNKKHLYSTKCIDKKGQAVFIKVILDNKPRFSAGLKKEAQILKYITNNQALNRKIKITKYLAGDLKGSMPWFIHKFIPGETMGEFYELSQPATKYIKPLIKNLVGLHNISPNHLRKIKEKVGNINTVKAKNYKNIIQEHQKNSPKLRKLIDFEVINRLFNQNYKYLKKAPIVLTQGDFTFANQIVAKNQVYLTDWEWVRFDNFCVDLAHLWIQSWRYPSWQKLLLKTYLLSLNKDLKKIFQESFRIIGIVQALNELRWNVEICPKKWKIKATNFCLKAIRNLLPN